MKISFTGDIGFTKYFTGLFDKPDLLDEQIVDFLNDCDTTRRSASAPDSSGSQYADELHR